MNWWEFLISDIGVILYVLSFLEDEECYICSKEIPYKYLSECHYITRDEPKREYYVCKSCY